MDKERLKLPWHESAPMNEARMQALPRMVRGYPYTRGRRILYECLTDPVAKFRKILSRLIRSSSASR